jgi:hypothetical protein
MLKAKIKINVKLVLLHQVMINALLMVKARTKTVVMTKWLLKNQVKKLKVAVNQIDRVLRIRGHNLDEVVGDVRRKVSTRRQLENFSEH